MKTTFAPLWSTWYTHHHNILIMNDGIWIWCTCSPFLGVVFNSFQIPLCSAYNNECWYLHGACDVRGRNCHPASEAYQALSYQLSDLIENQLMTATQKRSGVKMLGYFDSKFGEKIGEMACWKVFSVVGLLIRVLKKESPCDILLQINDWHPVSNFYTVVT